MRSLESGVMPPRYLEWAHELAQHDGTTAAIADSMAGTALFALIFGCPEHHTRPFWLSRAETALMQNHDVATGLKLCNHLLAYHLMRAEFNRMTRIMDWLGALKKEAEKHPAQHLLCLLLEAYCAANAQADAEAGRAIAQKGLALARETGVVIYNFWFSNLVVMGSLYLDDLQCAEEALNNMLPIGQPVPELRIADVSYLRGCPADALEHFKAAVQVYRRVGFPMSEALCLVNIANAFVLLGNVQDARSYLRQAEQLNWGTSWLSSFQSFLSKAWISFVSYDEEAGLEALRTGFAIGWEHGIQM